MVPRLYLDDSTQTQPPACPHGVGGCSHRCRIALDGLHHPRESILAPIDVMQIWTYGGLGMEKTIELQPDCFERQRNVAQGARWGYATTPQKIPVSPSRVPAQWFRGLCVVSTLENYYKSKFGLS